MTSGEEDDLACSYKTVIHRPTAHFYLPPAENFTLPMPPAAVPLTPSPLMQAPPLPPAPLPPLPVFVLPAPPSPSNAVNLPMHHRAHTDPDLLLYSQLVPPVFYAANWYPYHPPNFVYGPPPPPMPPPLPSVAFAVNQAQFRSSSADCRRTVHHVHEPHVIHPERVW